MFIQSCPLSGRVPSSTSTINQHPPALFRVPDSAQATIAFPLLGGLTLLVRYVVRCLTAGATTHSAAVVSGWSETRVPAFLHLARQRACWLVCAVARFCLDRMGADRILFTLHQETAGSTSRWLPESEPVGGFDPPSSSLCHSAASFKC